MYQERAREDSECLSERQHQIRIREEQHGNRLKTHAISLREMALESGHVN